MKIFQNGLKFTLKFPKNSMKNLKVLIVEDEQKLANLIRNSIKELFFKVANCKPDGIDGIQKV